MFSQWLVFIARLKGFILKLSGTYNETYLTVSSTMTLIQFIT